MAQQLVSIFLAAILTENYILNQFLGICPFLGVSKKLNTAFGMSCAVTFVMVLATAVTWPIYTYILYPNNLAYLQTIVFILIIAALVQFVETVLKKYMPPLYNSLGIYLPLITTNCAILGVTVLNIQEKYNFAEAMFNSFGSGLGFFLAMVLFSGIRIRTEHCDAPKSFKGLPITLVSAAILAAAFQGFGGVINSLFGR